MTYQEWCIETIKVILEMKNQDEGQYGYKMIIKDVIRHYPEVFMVEGEQIHFWTKALSQSRVDRFRQSFIDSFLMSERAREIAVRGDVEEIRRDLYQEHITPVQYAFEKLKRLRDEKTLSAESIKGCMSQNKLVLLHSEEKRYLDGQRFSDADFQCLQNVCNEVTTQYLDVDAELEEARNLIGRSSKDKGSGLFRVCKLQSSGITFFDTNGNVCSNERIVELLTREIAEYPV